MLTVHLGGEQQYFVLGTGPNGEFRGSWGPVKNKKAAELSAEGLRDLFESAGVVDVTYTVQPMCGLGTRGRTSDAESTNGQPAAVSHA